MLNPVWIPLITTTTWGFEPYPNDGTILQKWRRCPETTMAKSWNIGTLQTITYRLYFLVITICKYKFVFFFVLILNKKSETTKQPPDLLNRSTTQPYSTHAQPAMIFVSCVLMHFFQ